MFARLALMGWVFTPLSASAFCGTYVGSPDAELFSGVSQAVISREGDRTVLTLANDVEGNVRDFALVLPVPEVLDQAQVRIVDRGVLDRIGVYAGTRLVSYECSDFAWEEGWSEGSGWGCACRNWDANESDSQYVMDDPGEPLDVTIEAEFAAGEYDIVILSSEDSADLLTWLNREGYAVSEDAEAMLGDYIRSGSKFLAAKVRLDDVPVGGPAGRPYLSPLQLTYRTDVFSLPIRLGTLNSPGSQDVVVYTLTDRHEGQTSISNYRRVDLPLRLGAGRRGLEFGCRRRFSRSRPSLGVRTRRDGGGDGRAGTPSPSLRQVRSARKAGTSGVLAVVPCRSGIVRYTSSRAIEPGWRLALGSCGRSVAPGNGCSGVGIWSTTVGPTPCWRSFPPVMFPPKMGPLPPGSPPQEPKVNSA
jgi:hypothetical protein